MNTTLLLDYRPAPDVGGFIVRALLTVAGNSPAAATRAPLNLALILDRSGSMHGEKIDAARQPNSSGASPPATKSAPSRSTTKSPSSPTHWCQTKAPHSLNAFSPSSPAVTPT